MSEFITEKEGECNKSSDIEKRFKNYYEKAADKGNVNAQYYIGKLYYKGKGIENISQAKEPLFTTKPELERSGMGFTIMESFMDELKIESVIGVGTKITMKKVIKDE